MITINKEIFIVTGGILTNNVLDLLHREAIIIGVDRGAEWLIQNKIVPDYFVGDFDSAGSEFFSLIKVKYSDRIHYSPPEKDETDTELALQLAISLNPEQIKILGGIGTRLDHVLGNIHILKQGEEKGIKCMILGGNNRIQLLLSGKMKVIEKSTYQYVSLLPFTNVVEGISTTGFKYPLNNAKMEIGMPYGISNELMEDNGTVFIKNGVLLIIESKD